MESFEQTYDQLLAIANERERLKRELSASLQRCAALHNGVTAKVADIKAIQTGKSVPWRDSDERQDSRH